MKSFNIPKKYRSSVIGKIKEWRRVNDPRKKDFSPGRIDFEGVTFIIPRHMGFCYGVENAIEISYKAIADNPGKKIFLLSQMIHNPIVNNDLESLGMKFIMDTEGNQLISWNELEKDDVVVIPAFGTTIEIESLLTEKGVETAKYNTTCPFVEKVWKRSAEIGNKGFTVVIHGKHRHEETRATFSHSNQNAPSIIVRNMEEAKLLGRVIQRELTREDFFKYFEGKYSAGFDPEKDLRYVGVVNQTTMLATETQEIADYFRKVITSVYGEGHFADTRDTLCYATNDNQESTEAVLGSGADFALVVGGYNSSNTIQLVTILERKMPVYYISSADEILSPFEIRHFDHSARSVITTNNWLPVQQPVKIVLTSGASCPDAIVEEVLRKIAGYYQQEELVENSVSRWIESGQIN
ncbi:MAG: 4-hydroxy-3-methylbut-2-enyl diphosphate reductase [Crocinitomicaceae bacterium]|nr:4-hydroxy-3-methylbut-2-enyl diphosphate reductase [Crocinitomicaceae bacterium]